jgi:hypothetical protein
MFKTSAHREVELRWVTAKALLTQPAEVNKIVFIHAVKNKKDGVVG